MPRKSDLAQGEASPWATGRAAWGRDFCPSARRAQSGAMRQHEEAGRPHREPNNRSLPRFVKDEYAEQEISPQNHRWFFFWLVLIGSLSMEAKKQLGIWDGVIPIILAALKVMPRGQGQGFVFCLHPSPATSFHLPNHALKGSPRILFEPNLQNVSRSFNLPGNGNQQPSLHKMPSEATALALSLLSTRL